MNGSTAVKAILPAQQLQHLIDLVHEQGYRLIGPAVEEHAIVYREIDNLEELPLGLRDDQAPGRYRLAEDQTSGYFGHVVGQHSLKQFLFPPRQQLWSASLESDGIRIEQPQQNEKYAFLGVRACDLKAVAIQDVIFTGGEFVDHGYRQRRENALIIAVNCSRAASTCFCTSMNAGPAVEGDFDLRLTELQEQRHDLLIEAGSETGRSLLQALPTRAAEAADIEQAERVTRRTAESIQRRMPQDIGEVLQRHIEDDHWLAVAERCLNCGNCTLACPTCFCNTVEDTTDLSGRQTERWRYWDSCFTLDFSYIHGGSIRQSGESRYRQWMTHKLSHWYEQFGSSGCVGCGRCITWCPVGIDITEEAAAICEKETRS